MKSGLLLSAAVAAAVLGTMPALALQVVTLPQSGDATTNLQNPDAPAQDRYSTDQSGKDANGFGLGSFHFNVTQGSDWPGDPYHFNHPQNSTPDAYGSANTPGSEFSNSLLIPH